MTERVVATSKAQEPKQTCPNSCKRNTSYSSSGTPTDRILQLQRIAGNQAVQRLIKSRALQAKLRIGQPNDIYEQEADRVAEQVMRMPDPVLQRKCAKCNKYEKKVLQAKKSQGQMPVNQGQDVFSTVQEVIRSPGQPLDPGTRAFMEPRFGHDFSNVRVHSEEQAAVSAKAIDANAYTIGQNIVFADGKYAPRTDAGKELIAHELTHVVQQSGAASDSVAIQRDERELECVGAYGIVPKLDAEMEKHLLMVEPAHHLVSGTPPYIQRFSGQPSGQLEGVPASVDRALASPGRPLEPALRQDMEQRFGHDFSRVRMHSGAAAEQSAHEVRAHAYTVGHDIVLGSHRFTPATREGRRLLAHELTHVVQQTTSGAMVQRQSTRNVLRHSGRWTDIDSQTVLGLWAKEAAINRL